MTSPLHMGWFGLGSMGLGMAMNLQRHLATQGGPPLHYSNRSLEKGQPLQEAGAVPEKDFASLVRQSDVLYTMISNDEVLLDLVDQALSTDVSLEGKIFVDTSTVHPDTSALAAQRLGERGAAFIASPVFGASRVAAAGKLIFAMAGPAAALQTVRPQVDVMGRAIIDLGEDVRKSSLLKITGNILVISFMEVISEAQVFAEVTGIGSQQLEEFIGNMFGPVLESYSHRITSGAYAPPLETPPGFAAALACKDMKHALSLAAEHHTRLPTVEIASSRLNAARDYAGENLDSAALYGIARQETGLPFWTANSRQGN
ncbi:NAD(P)-dependent oxidoreductase [Aspergillus ibericus CBS 121593]|uniref:6-phosphogluconate dehydrogenase family protein n=1 Tax=Aspergillus ibericus CBS 121593 TaxID=1448316 RepID=A0A395H8W0_9EURO|nr:6-phosphogluconate dehydrogenase family protein [Aspergillus ibericus CBS 121593]RAL02674.1 6-phosphogluconate dehydrogenase family protein [Aspergillus ibericus CBS 121593]